MLRRLRPLIRPVTYTRWLHLFMAVTIIGIWVLIYEDRMYVPPLLLALAGLVPAMRTVEGLQARLLLTRHGFRESASSITGADAESNSGIAAAPSVSWADRGRTVLWLELRLALGTLTGYLTIHLPGLGFDLVRAATGSTERFSVLELPGGHWWYGVLAPLPFVALLAFVVGAGELITAIARRLLGPSPQERLAALEERTEQLLERNRIARELHDSIGHALTVAVVQAGAARAAGSPEFTERALSAIEETGRAALEDLERVLLVLRESGQPVSGRPTLADTDRLLESARASGAEVHAEVTGPVAEVPGPVSREGYRIVQESLTNVLRHAGPVVTRVRIAVADERLVLEVSNPLSGATAGRTAANGRGGGGGSGGSGLRGIRERAALLGGDATTGPYEGGWRVRVGLPLTGPP